MSSGTGELTDVRLRRWMRRLPLPSSRYVRAAKEEAASLEAACRQTGDAVLGEIITAVTYVDLVDRGPWDVGHWHWLWQRVELSTRSGRGFVATWSEQIINCELTFEERPISDPLPLEDPEFIRVWDVSDHPQWRPLLGQPILRYDVALEDVERLDADLSGFEVPLAVRLATADGLVWLVAAGIGATDPGPELRDAYLTLGADEVAVLFDDELASAIGLGRCRRSSGVFERR
jgi:hypothetical protein